MSEPKTCPYSGLAVLSCKVSDLCDCFEFPHAERAAAEVIARRDTQPATETPHAPAETEESSP